MKQIPMMLRLSFILVCVMAIPLAVLTWFSGTQILRNSEQAIAESALAGLNANRMLNENALANLSQNTVRLASTGIFDRIRPIESYAELNENYQNVSQGNAVLDELLTLNQSIDGVYSSFFYLTDTDYVVSTDKGISTLEKYEPIDWLKSELQEQISISGKWYPRRNASNINVISFVLPLNRLATTTRGTIVINLKEDQIERYLQSTESGKQNYLLMDAQGTTLSHSDKSLFLENQSKDPLIRKIVEQKSSEGYAIDELNGRRLLYAWSRSQKLGWINVSTYSVDELMNNTRNLQYKIALLTLVIIFVGSILSVVLATWLYKPIRTLVRTVSERVNLGGGTGKNELVFLEEAFRRMQDEEEELQKLLDEREHGFRDLAIRNLLRGEVTPTAEEIFTAPHFLVAVVCIDGYRDYISRNNPETRKYHQYSLISLYDKLFPYDATTRCVYHGDGLFVMIINHGKELYTDDGKIIAAILGIIKDTAKDTLGHSVSIGVSSSSALIDNLANLFSQAMEAIKLRLVAGSGCILHWREDLAGNQKYVYPANSEKKILNFVDNGSLPQIKEELGMIRNEIRSSDNVSFDNILFIYNQLAGATIKHLRENNINMTRILGIRGSIYAALAACDTLDEIEEYLLFFYSEIVQYFANDSKESNHYVDHIIQYLNENYCKEIVFEDMAKEIGISYSYMRKVTYEMTGLSLMDNLNKLRIEKTKDFLANSDLTVAQIATMVGYNSVRSLNHFFRKFEGVTPGNFKNAMKSKYLEVTDQA